MFLNPVFLCLITDKVNIKIRFPLLNVHIILMVNENVF